MTTLPIYDLGICAILQKNDTQIEIGYYLMNEKMLLKRNKTIETFDNVDDLFTYKTIAKHLKKEYDINYFSIGLRCKLNILYDSETLRTWDEKYPNQEMFYNVYPITKDEYFKFFNDIKN